MHTHVQQSPLPCTRSIGEPWHQRSSYADLRYGGFNPNGKRTSPLSLLQGVRGKKQGKSRGKADLQAISQPQAPVLGLLNWKQQHRAVTRPVLQALHCHQDFSHPQAPHFGCNSVVTVTCTPAIRTGSWGTLDTKNVSLGMIE